MHNGHFESVLVALVQFEWVNFGDEKQEWFGRKNFENTRNYFFFKFPEKIELAELPVFTDR